MSNLKYIENLVVTMAPTGPKEDLPLSMSILYWCYGVFIDKIKCDDVIDEIKYCVMVLLFVR